jgi:prepilin-type N-terminal cleavage/methylation domain-containing protein/prepilin-type processing-associated H-X9-DG protein
MMVLSFNSQKAFGKIEVKPQAVSIGFTLIELLIVIAIIAILAAILLPVLASAKVRAERAQCLNNLKEVAGGILIFDGDNNNTFPPAAWSLSDSSDPGSSSAQVTWDSLIYSYIGGGNGQATKAMDKGTYANDALDAQTLGIAPGLKIMACPFDNFPKVTWMTTPSGSQLTVAVKDYEMVSSGAGKSYQGANNLVQRSPANGLPNITTPGFLGVGIYWADSNIRDAANWNPLGFPESVVRHPSGTIMLAEVASSQGSEGNVWPCCCCGPTTTDGTSGGWGNLYQIDTSAPQSAATLESGGYNEGQQLYKAQQNRFNYAFHDGHVETLMYQQTIGVQTSANTLGGMWNITTAN